MAAARNLKETFTSVTWSKDDFYKPCVQEESQSDSKLKKKPIAHQEESQSSSKC